MRAGTALVGAAASRGGSRRRALPARLALALELPQVVVEVDLHRVARRGVEVLGVALVVGCHLATDHGVGGGQVAAAEHLGDPRGLGLRQRHDRADRLEQAEEEQAGQVGVDGPLPQRQLVGLDRDQVVREEREAHAVAGGPDDQVGGSAGAVDEHDAVGLEPVDRGLRGDRPGREPLADLLRLHRVRLAGLVGRGGEAVLGHAARGGRADPQARRGDPPRHPARGQQALVARLAEEELAQHPLGTPHRPGRRTRGEGRLDGDVHGRVAGTDDDHVAARELVAGAVVVGVDLLAVERARVGRLGPPRVPVVPVGDEHGVVGAGLGAAGAGDAYVPATVGGACDVLDGGVEGDRVAEAEVVDVVVEVGRDLVVARVVRVVLGHREVRVGHPRAGGVDLEGVVAGGLAVGVVEDPGPADVAALLEAVEPDAGQVEVLGRGDARGPGADHARAGQ